MEHVLDNPAYNALATGNENLAYGNQQVKYFDKEVSPFIGFEENTAANFHKGYGLVTHNYPVVFISPVQIEIPGEWKMLQYIPCLQMIYHGDTIPVNTSHFVTLTDEHIPQMLELTKLTNPGPFLWRTIDFGHYRGIVDGGQLIAMAGQRMNPLPYAEISAVCTHPDYTGKGYAKQLLQYHINRVTAEGNIPFLHVKRDNTRAVKVYENMGFVNRKDMHFYVLAK
jgi:ribosomal protein S18 acetylase RimI-like enzyme